MNEASQSTRTPSRSTIAGLSAVLVIAVVFGSSFTLPEAGAGNLGRASTPRNLAPARQFAASLAKAVRDLVGDQHKPALQDRSTLFSASCAATAAVIVLAEPRPITTRLVRVEHLDLPPPLSAA